MKKVICAALACAVIFLSGCVKAPAPEGEEEKVPCIIVDAGHGLSDVGAIHEENLGSVTEAMINLSVAAMLRDNLTELGYKVIMTHDGKEKPPTEYDDGEETYGPSERADFANASEGDLFISIHCDSFPENESVYGTRVYYAIEKLYDTKHDKKLAEAVTKKLDGAALSDKDVIIKEMAGAESYTVLYKTDMPALLIECGFITNKDDAKRMLDPQWQESFAKAIASGIEKYLK